MPGNRARIKGKHVGRKQVAKIQEKLKASLDPKDYEIRDIDDFIQGPKNY